MSISGIPNSVIFSGIRDVKMRSEENLLTSKSCRDFSDQLLQKDFCIEPSFQYMPLYLCLQEFFVLVAIDFQLLSRRFSLFMTCTQFDNRERLVRGIVGVAESHRSGDRSG